MTEKSQTFTVAQPVGWQSVETAPHGIDVLLGYLNDYSREWVCEVGQASHGWTRNGISTMSRHGQATHWQPLPLAPGAAQPPAAPVEPIHMTYDGIKAAFDEYRKTLTVMDTRPSFDSFSQGYVAGWNAKEAQDAQLRSSAETARQALDELRRDTKKLARELQQGLPKRNAAERLEAISASADRALAAQSSPAPVETDRTHVFEEAGFDTCRFCGERKSSKDHLPDLPQGVPETIDTAPKDGSHILAWRIPIGIHITNNTHPPTVVHWFDDPDEPGFYTSVNERAPEHPFNPTHWAPLPEGPR